MLFRSFYLQLCHMSCPRDHLGRWVSVLVTSERHLFDIPNEANQASRKFAGYSVPDRFEVIRLDFSFAQ